MESDRTGGPAFPVPGLHVPDALSVMPKEGMTLRDYFAAQILPAIYTGERLAREGSGLFQYYDWRAELAKDAYLLADAMLAERAKEQA